jgi:hypothetical protein
MNEFNIQFYGLYAALFLTPIAALILQNRFVKSNRYIIGFAAFALVGVYVAIMSGLSLLGISADAVFLYFIYLLAGIAVFKITSYNNLALKILGGFGAVPFVAIPLASIVAVVGVALAVGDFQTEYEVTDSVGYSCRVTTYGNATTSTGGYKVNIYKKYGFIEREINFETVETTRNPEITAERVCSEALSEKGKE